MEAVQTMACTPDVACWEELDPDTALELQDDLGSPPWDDALLNQLRDQAKAGCLLCSLDEWNEEDQDDA
jgi:hypothetical protein